MGANMEIACFSKWLSLSPVGTKPQARQLFSDEFLDTITIVTVTGMFPGSYSHHS